MQAIHFFRNSIDTMFNLNSPLAVLATPLPWRQIESTVATKFEHQNEIPKAQDMFGTTVVLVGVGRSDAGRPKLPMSLMASLFCLKHYLNLGDEELLVRWSKNVLWQSSAVWPA